MYKNTYPNIAAALERVTAPVSDERDADGQRVLVDIAGNTVNRVSDSYTLVQNRDIIKPIVDAFGVDKVKRVVTYGRNKYTHVALETGREFAFEYNGERDVIKERLIIENSYNKSRSFRFMFGAFRMVCSNGMYQGQATFAIRRIHTGKIDVAGIVRETLGQWEKNSFDLWRDFQATPMTTEEELGLVASFKPFDEGRPDRDALTGACVQCGAPSACNCGNWHAQRANRAIRRSAENAIAGPESLNNQRNAWGLLNGLNRAIAVNLGTPSALPRLIAANVEAENAIARAVLGAKQS